VVPVHFVWATYQRHPLITDSVREPLYRCITAEVVRLKAEVLAIGGLADHVHLAVMFPATVSIGDFMKQIKGASSAAAQGKMIDPESFFKWQEGYGAFAFHTNMIDDVVFYVETQEARHARNNLSPNLEAMYEEVPERK
jgi:putative transposase